MFRILRSVKGHLAALARTFDPDTLTVAQAAEAISLLAAIEKAAAGLRLLLARRVDNQSLWGESGERSAADWLARQTGQSTNDAARDLECSRRLQALPEASDAVRNGELSPDQAKAVADGAAADPAAEQELLDTARRGSLGELNRKAKSRKAAALGDDEARARAAHRNRSFTSGTNAMGEGWGRFNGPAHQVALLNAQLKPFLERAFAGARRKGRRERADALAYDALMAFAGIVDLDLDGPGSATESSAASGDGTQDSPPRSADTPSGDGAQDAPPRSTATASGDGVGAPAGHSNAGGDAPDAGSQPTGGRETAATSGARRARTPGAQQGTRPHAEGASDGQDATAPQSPAGRAAAASAPLTLLDGLDGEGLDGLDGDGLDGDGLDGDADDLAAGSGTPRGPGPGSAGPPGAAPPSPPGSTSAPPPLRPKREPIRPDVKLIVRIDGSALQRGHTVPGELCDLHGFGPVSVADVKALLPDAAIDFVITNGRDVFNVSHLGRHATARQQVVLDLLNIGCSREGCGATQHLQVDHRIDWHKIKVTELANLDWLCPHDHRLKTHEGWQLEPGTGKRPMCPPGQQPWLEGAETPATGTPPHAA
ncbi:MAG: DUF222 domain-containing protein [Acidimicrobiales bacterium]|nr:DUF222 domain-containing protein [Acidimicrobiales bacterium]